MIIAVISLVVGVILGRWSQRIDCVEKGYFHYNKEGYKVIRSDFK